jgi:DNA-binding response OmpR family regulator
MLPDADGLSLLRELRQTIGDDLPVIMITAAGEEVDRIVGLEVGADDYLPKPFNPRELLARVRAVFRRAGRNVRADAAAARQTMRFAGYELDPQARSLRNQSGAQIDLTTGEFELLLALVQRPNRVLSRDQLMSLVKGDDAVLYDRSVDAQISRLRRKIEEDPEHPLLIKTVRNIGYIFSVAVT